LFIFARFWKDLKALPRYKADYEVSISKQNLLPSIVKSRDFLGNAQKKLNFGKILCKKVSFQCFLSLFLSRQKYCFEQ